MRISELPCRDMTKNKKPFAHTCPAITELKQITRPVESRECEFKRVPACRIYSICERTGFGPNGNTVNTCSLYWRLKVARAQKRLGLLP